MSYESAEGKMKKKNKKKWRNGAIFHLTNATKTQIYLEPKNYQ